MLIIPEWFSKPEWVKSFDELRQAIHEAAARRNKVRARRRTLRPKWRLARASTVKDLK